MTNSILEISIIVCTHNRGKSIGETIQSLRNQTFPVENFEVVVVDNGSTDNTRQTVEENSIGADNINYIFEPMLGLSIARNRGIKESQGEIIAFIDDDAVAVPNWINEVLNRFSDPAVWAVGGRAVARWPVPKPVWMGENLSDYLGLTNYGDQTRFLTYPHYPVGVNMAFRREVFDVVGMFSEDFGRKGSKLLSNEEFDYCYKVEKAGGKIAYAPNAIVQHCISLSRISKWWFLKRAYWQGRSQHLSERKHFDREYVSKRLIQFRHDIVKRIRKIFREEDKFDFILLFRISYLIGYFVETVLANYSKLNGYKSTLVENNRQKILFMCPEIPYPPTAGNKIRKFNLLKQLSKYNDITLVPFFINVNDNENTETFQELLKYGIKLKNYKSHTPWYGKQSLGMKFLNRYFYLWLEFRLLTLFPRWFYINYDYNRFIQQELNSGKYNLILLEKPWLAPYVAKVRGIRKILGLQDVVSDVAKRKLPFANGIVSKVKAWKHYLGHRHFESNICQFFDTCLVPSETDKDKLISLIGATISIEVIPNGVDTSFFHAENDRGGSSIVFTGTMDYSPNIEGVLFFVHKILPLVKQTQPSVTFSVVGRKPPAEIMALEGSGVHIYADVPDVRPYIYDSTVYVVPLLVGGGTRLKILEAMACGRAVVSTTLGAEGLNVTNNENILIADTPDEFANAVIRLLKDPKLNRNIVEAGRRLVEEQYDWNRIGKKLTNIVRLFIPFSETGKLLKSIILNNYVPSHPLVTELVAKTQVSIIPFKVNPDSFQKYFQRWEYDKMWYGKNTKEKALEHFISLELLQPVKGDVFMDVASKNSPVPRIVESTYGCTVFKQDLSYTFGIHGQCVGGDAGNLPFAGNSIDYMTLHCSFEHFEGDADVRFIKEAARVLKQGGKVCILPLYLKSEYYIVTRAPLDQSITSISDGAEVRVLINHTERFGRMYNVTKLKERIFDNCTGVKPTIYYLENENQIDISCYLKFILLLSKET
ncbi:MAG: hypothetical protein C0417_12310 [Chlorobiaceae bacterium]|nr:hypothetical protein [Chlorobiaceae bacterium]